MRIKENIHMKNFLIFFAVMLLLTLLSRAASAMTMAKVYSVSPFSAEMTDEIDAEGYIAAKECDIICGFDGLKAEQVFFKPGDTVSEGDVLIKFEEQSADILYKRGKLELDKLKISASQLGVAVEYSEDMTPSQKRQAELENQQRSVERSLLKLDIEEKEAQLLSLKEICENDYAVTAKRGGVISEMNVSEGQTVTGDIIAKVDVISNGYSFITKIHEDYLKNLFVKMSGTLTLTGFDSADSVIESIGSIDSEGFAEVRVSVPSDIQNIIIGLSGNFNIVFSRRAFSCCVPLSCVYSDGDGCFVYKVTQKKTIFGIENTVVKEAVQLQAQDDKYAAINCSVSKGETILISSSKAVKDGDRVRLMI